MDPVLVALIEKRDGADACGGEKLYGEDGINLADELVANVDCGFGDGASKLEVIGQVILTAARLSKDAAAGSPVVMRSRAVRRRRLGIVLSVGLRGLLVLCG